MIRYGIYGYETTQNTEFNGFHIVSLNNNYKEVKVLASDLDNYNLTAFIEIDQNIIEDIKPFIFDMQGILSFIDQKNVLIANSLHEHESYNNLDEDFPKKLNGIKRINGGGNVILSDAFSENSRKDFICKALNKLNNDLSLSHNAFRGAFFRSIEVFRGSASFIDVDYYLLFSGLESLSRAALNDYDSKNCSTPIAKFLEQYDFDISQDNPQDLEKAVSTYAHLRNSLFHNGKYEAEININGDIKILKLSTYYSQLNMLMPLVIMKYIGFDDGHINWNCWLDRMMFR